MNKKGGLSEFLLTYGWLVLVLLVLVAGIAYFAFVKPGASTQQPPVHTYDCGNIFVRGNEATTGELQNASFAVKQARDTLVNETTFTGKFLKAYYDMNNCVLLIETNEAGKVSLTN